MLPKEYLIPLGLCRNSEDRITPETLVHTSNQQNAIMENILPTIRVLQGTDYKQNKRDGRECDRLRLKDVSHKKEKKKTYPKMWAKLNSVI